MVVIFFPCGTNFPTFFCLNKPLCVSTLFTEFYCLSSNLLSTKWCKLGIRNIPTSYTRPENAEQPDLQRAKAIEGLLLDFFQTQRSSRITAHRPYHLLQHTLLQFKYNPHYEERNPRGYGNYSQWKFWKNHENAIPFCQRKKRGKKWRSMARERKDAREAGIMGKDEIPLCFPL